MSGLIISVSGLRGVVGEELDASVVARYVTAFAAGLPQGLVVVTRDGRPSGEAFARTIAEALTPHGFEVLDGAVAATPTTGVLVRQYRAVAGIQVSASHNPSQYNGLKLFDEEGKVLSAGKGEAVLRRYEQDDVALPKGNHGSVRFCDDTTSEHLRKILATVDVGAIRKRRFKVLLDANHGAGAALGSRLLAELGAEVRVLGETADGQFEHPPEPLAENLAHVGEQVVGQGADVGFCQDPDADRLAVIDEQGRYVGEEYTLALCLDHVLRRTPGTAVTNCATSRMAEEIAARHGSKLLRTAVGEANVVEGMLASGAVFGGEGNGGPIDPRVGYVRDSFVGMAQILAACAARESAVSGLVDELPRFQILKAKVELATTNIAAVLDALERSFPSARASRFDGLRLEWDDRWLLVRASNTEPIVRIIAEAPGRDDAADLCRQAEMVMRDLP
ncbi:MAG: phosphoglucosamine mutase [Pirellulaceae bacterium]